jgi:hypothetical protein
MATVIDRLNTLVRVNLDDEIKSRYTDAQLLVFMKQALRRAQGIGFARRLNFMRAKKDYVVAADAVSIPLPNDFIVQIGIWNTDESRELENKNDEDWERILSTGPAYCYHIEGILAEIRESPQVETNIRLRYYQDAKVDELTLSSQMPWGSKIDYPICEYVTMRALHVDRYNTSVDASLMSDMEQSIISMYSEIDPVMGDAVGTF